MSWFCWKKERILLSKIQRTAYASLKAYSSRPRKEKNFLFSLIKQEKEGMSFHLVERNEQNEVKKRKISCVQKIKKENFLFKKDLF
jgi:hypothetical protein